ncbi:MAG: Holliday junction resolvase RuvX [Alphaproteobacteria bacterium]|nr:Holliday junction resolvase RuvX [Alphaproteobacteria bacterium]MCZ6847737.1 Holliday junction resolvase RuvX [Alphaproteobacteria bacterium]
MTIRKPRELTEGLATGARILALDLGTRTIGLALSDVERTIATPFDTIRRTKLKPDIGQLMGVIADQGVGALVLGLPVNMDDSEGPRCQATRQFATDLLLALDLPLAFWDERLSSYAAEAALLEADVSAKHRAEIIDKVAAAVILQGYLDFLAAGGGGS